MGRDRSTDQLEQSLITNAIAGKEAAFDELFRRHGDRSWRLALAITGDPDLAAEVVPAAFATTLDAIAREVDDEGRPFDVLVLIATRNAAVAATQGTPEPIEHLDDDVAAIWADLPEHWRTALWLHHGQGLDARAIGHVLGLAEPLVTSMLERAAESFTLHRIRLVAAPLGPTCGPAVARLAASHLEPDAAAALERHLALCPECRERAEAAETALDVIATVTTPIPTDLAAVARAGRTAVAAPAALAAPQTASASDVDVDDALDDLRTSTAAPTPPAEPTPATAAPAVASVPPAAAPAAAPAAVAATPAATTNDDRRGFLSPRAEKAIAIATAAAAVAGIVGAAVLSDVGDDGEGAMGELAAPEQAEVPSPAAFGSDPLDLALDGAPETPAVSFADPAVPIGSIRPLRGPSTTPVPFSETPLLAPLPIPSGGIDAPFPIGDPAPLAPTPAAPVGGTNAPPPADEDEPGGNRSGNPSLVVEVPGPAPIVIDASDDPGVSIAGNEIGNPDPGSGEPVQVDPGSSAADEEPPAPVVEPAAEIIVEPIEEIVAPPAPEPAAAPAADTSGDTADDDEELLGAL